MEARKACLARAVPTVRRLWCDSCTFKALATDGLKGGGGRKEVGPDLLLSPWKSQRCSRDPFGSAAPALNIWLREGPGNHRKWHGLLDGHLMAQSVAEPGAVGTARAAWLQFCFGSCPPLLLSEPVHGQKQHGGNHQVLLLLKMALRIRGQAVHMASFSSAPL